MESGQYDKTWKYLHMQPEEGLQAALDLRTRHFAPVHWGEFTEADHACSEPIKQISGTYCERKNAFGHAWIGQLIDFYAITTLSPWRKSVR